MKKKKMEHARCVQCILSLERSLAIQFDAAVQTVNINLSSSLIC